MTIRWYKLQGMLFVSKTSKLVISNVKNIWYPSSADNELVPCHYSTFPGLHMPPGQRKLVLHRQLISRVCRRSALPEYPFEFLYSTPYSCSIMKCSIKKLWEDGVLKRWWRSHLPIAPYDYSGSLWTSAAAHFVEFINKIYRVTVTLQVVLLLLLTWSTWLVSSVRDGHDNYNQDLKQMWTYSPTPAKYAILTFL